MASPSKVRRPGLWLALAAVVAGSIALWSFPRAMPILALGQRLTRQAALQKADSFFRAHDLAPEGARTAVRFRSNDSLSTYIDLAGGGFDSLNATLRGRDVTLYTWSVRAFIPLDPHEARVDFAPDGRIVGFRRVLAEADRRPEVSAEEGRRLAEEVLASWIGDDPARWRLATSSYETRKASGRVDRTYTFERTDRRIVEAPIRLDVVIAGDLPAGARPYVVIPESFQRRYGEMRSANDLLALIAQALMLGYLILGAVVLRRYAIRREVRWRPALIVGGVIGALVFAAGLNELPGSWFGYDTATSPGTFLATQAIEALVGGVGLVLLVGLTVAAAEAGARHGLPRHPDWWKVWEWRGTREVAGRIATGYVAALVSMAYVGLFYLATRDLLGWWVPSELLDDPNLVSTPMPWLSGIALSLQAGVWEESLFRALPLSLLALWVRDRAHRRWWLAAGVVATALVFGFAHANYPSWPPYSRGVEIFLSACFWAVLFLWLGLVVTVIAHFTYDLILFGLFAASGSAPAYRVSAAVILLALLLPALGVAWRWLRQRGLEALPDQARFGAWRAAPVARAEPAPTPARPSSLTPRARQVAVVAALAALILVIFVPSASILGRPFTAGRSQVLATADSVARAHGVDPARWRRLAATTSGAQEGWVRFLVEEDAVDLADTLAATFSPVAWWTVRYVHTEGTAAERAEEWRIRLWPNGSPLDVHHVVPDSARGDSLAPDQARRIARAAIAAAGIDTLVLRETDLEATDRPARRDFTVTYTDTTVAVPDDAAARVRVTLAGSEPLVVRRSLELPEAFTRAQRERQSTQLVTTLVCGLLFLALVVGGVVFVIRRHPVLLEDEAIGRKAGLAVVGFLTVVAAGAALDALPSRLFGYDTAMPWSNWLSINLVAAVGAVVPALAFLGLWLALSALRRRAGVSLLPPEPGHGRDVLLAGLGLGATFTLLRMALAASRSPVVPGAPQTTLGEAMPLLTHALSVPTGVAFAVTFVAIPALVVAGIGRRRASRAAAAVALLAPLLALALAVAPIGASAVGRTAEMTAALLVAAGVSVWLWAPYCTWAWLLAALADAGFGAVRSTFHAPTGVERAAGALALATVVGLSILVWRLRHIASAPPPAQGDAAE
jgi:membrane protease YdiL (CAAX protease family)